MGRNIPAFWLIAAIGVVFLGCYGLAAVEVVRYAASGKDYGYFATGRDDKLIVTRTIPGSPAEKFLKAGDQIVAVDGYRQVPVWLKGRLILLAPAGGSYTLSIRRGQTELRVQMPVALVKGGALPVIRLRASRPARACASWTMTGQGMCANWRTLLRARWCSALASSSSPRIYRKQ